MINLCFHGIGTCLREREEGESRYWISECRFSDILDVVEGQPHVRLSFDDGNASDIQTALPELIRRGLTAIFFPVASRLDNSDSISAVDLRQLRAAGMSIGSHGWAHIPWRHLAPAQQHQEFVEARTALAEASGGDIDEAALPLGRFDRRVLASLRRYGYRAVYSSDRLPARRNAWLQGRFSVTRADTAESVRAIIQHRTNIRDTRDLTASFIKRLR